MQISRGVIPSALKAVIYGPEGIGKSSYAAQFPRPVFIDTEGSTTYMDVARTPKPSSWTMLMEQVRYFKLNPNDFDTLVIDTADWAERLCMEDICARANKSGIEDFGYGKGFNYLMEEFGRLLNLLQDIVDLGMNVVIVAHAQMRKFEQPDELGAYDRWELKLQKKTAPLVKEWADMVLFFNYKTFVVNVDGQGAEKGTNKAQGGKRVIYTTHHPCWDAKSRHHLPEEMTLDFNEIETIIPARESLKTAQVMIQQSAANPIPVEEDPARAFEAAFGSSSEDPAPPTDPPKEKSLWNLPRALTDLMEENQVTVEEIQAAVARRGYYPQATPIENYDPQFIQGVLIGAWQQVFGMILEMRRIPA